MTWLDPGASAWRRRTGLAVLVVGVALAAATVDKDLPREQRLVFRLGDEPVTTLTASFTKVGESEARTGFTLAVEQTPPRDVSHPVSLPNGDYIVTLEIRRPKTAGAPDETNLSRRVTLSGSEIVVPVTPRASE